MISYQLTQFAQPLEPRERDTPVPEGDEVLLRVEACGVCHSDVHLRDGFFDLGGGRRLDLARGRSLPLTLGHEIAGEVVAIGSSSVGASVGQRCVVYPWLGCGNCVVCASGQEHLCASPRSLGVVEDGGFADYVVVPHARYLFDAGSVDLHLACTYACSGLTAYSALKKVQMTATGRHLVIIGVGGVGSAALSIASSLFDATVVAVDIDEDRRQAARQAGADEVLDPREEGVAKRLRRLTSGGAAAVVDFVGSADSAGLGLQVLGTGGTLVVVGLFGGALPIQLPLLPLRQLTVRGSFVGSPAEMAALMSLVREGRIPPIPIATRPLTDAQIALDRLQKGQITGRVVLCPDKPERE